jgi:hypothetical protein
VHARVWEIEVSDSIWRGVRKRAIPTWVTHEAPPDDKKSLFRNAKGRKLLVTQLFFGNGILLFRTLRFGDVSALKV